MTGLLVVLLLVSLAGILVGPRLYRILWARHRARQAARWLADLSTMVIIDGWLVVPVKSSPELVYLQCVHCWSKSSYRNAWADPVSLDAVRLHLQTIGACRHDREWQL